MKKFTLLPFLVIILIVSACEQGRDTASGSSVAPATPSAKQVHLLTWEEYLPESTIEKFEKASGYQLVQHYFDNSDDQIGLMTAHPHRYDVIVISHEDLQIFTQRSLISKLDQTRLVGTERIGEKFRGMPNDPDDEYSVPYLWGGYAVAYRKDLIVDPEPSLSLFFEDDTPGKRLLFDEAADVIALANSFIGKPPGDYSEETLERTAKVISGGPRGDQIVLQPSSQMIASIAEGEFIVAVNYSGDIAAAAEENPNIGYFLPKEGTPLWLDELTISRDSKNPAGAYAFLNFLLEPENIAEVSNELWYPNAIPESYPLISEELRSDHALFPPDDYVARAPWCTGPVGDEVKRVAQFLRAVRKGRTPGSKGSTVSVESNLPADR